MNIKSAVSEFLLDLEVSGMKKSTVTWYRDILNRYVGACGDSDVRKVTPHDVRMYLKDVQASYASESSVSAFSRPVHRFWKWAALEYNITNPARNIKYPGKVKPSPKAASLDDIERMYQATEDTDTGTRDRALLAFLLDTGVRSQSLRELRIVNLDIDGRKAIVTEKGSKTRTVVFTSHTAALLQAWLAVREEVDVVFYSISTLDELTQRGLYQLLRRLARRAGVQGAHNPHAFRHAFAKGYIQNGGDLATLSLLMGHRDGKTTIDHYLVYTDSEIAARHDEFSPVKQLVAMNKKAP